MRSMPSKIVLVTGASSGIGQACALELLAAGHTVYGTGRRMEGLEPVRAAGGRDLAMDVTSRTDRERVVAAVLAEQGRIDALVNNAGFGLYGAAEDVPLDEARHQLEVNLLGPAGLIQLVLPQMRAQRSGTIVNVSSMGGQIALPFGAWYHASKHGLEGYSDALRQEVRDFGIRVVLIEPGVTKTGFGTVMGDGLRRFSERGAYREGAEAWARVSDKSYAQAGNGSDPEVVARAVRRAIESRHPRVRYRVGHLAKASVYLDTFLPAWIVDRLASLQVRRRPDRPRPGRRPR
jgi:NAD(P)-dependent dehydrogenase (short-subunit alcohol dehydrogenase family)